MSQHDGGRRERRHHIRIAPKGTVNLVAGEHALRGRIANLCQGGMLIATAIGAPSKLLARRVELELRLDGHQAEWTRATGQVIRIQPDGIAISFEEISQPLARLIEQMTAASRAHLLTPLTVLLDADPDRRSTMAKGFYAAGCRVVETATPLEAIVRLGESTFEPDLIAIADSTPAAVADDLRRFVERNHPRAKLVTIGNGMIEPQGIPLWLSSANPRADLEARICEILDRPQPR